MIVQRTMIFLAFLAAITACGSDNGTDGAMSYWSSSNPEEMAFARMYIDRWNTAHPENLIAFQPVPEGQSSEEVILAAVVGQTTPDIYANMWQGDVEDYARAGALIPLDTLDGFMEFLYQRCDSAVVREITSTDGHIYQVPWKVNPIMVLYNSRLFEEYGVEDISTYSRFLEAGKRLTNDLDGDAYTDLYMGSSEVSAIWWQRFFNFLPLYYAASGGQPLVRNEEVIFNNEHSVAVMDFLQEIYERGYFPKEQRRGQVDPFIAGRIALRFTGPWAIRNLERFKPDGFEYDFAPVPVPDDHDGPVYTYGDPKNIVIFSNCRDPETAWKFLKTMLTAEADLTFLEMSQQFPRRKDLDSNPAFREYFAGREKLNKFARQVRHLRGMDSSPGMKEVLDLISQEYEACVVYGNKPAQESVEDAAEAVELMYLR